MDLINLDEIAVIKKKKLTLGKCIRRFFLCLSILLLSVLIFLFGIVYLINYGPSPAARNLFVLSVMETSSAKFLATWFFTTEQIEEFITENSPKAFTEEIDETIVNVPIKDENKTEDVTFEDIEIVDVKGPNYKGKMMIIHDPSRVFLATAPQFGSEEKGEKLVDLIEKNNAIAGVNAGGFRDEVGYRSGGEPLGIVMSQGVVLSGEPNTEYQLIGLDNNNRLILGVMTVEDAIAKGIRDAVTFKPILVLNGKGAKISGTGGGLNPRTAIGQRADGSILLLVVDGRQIHSLGASFKDLIDIMLDFDAVNAANLDGGSSSLMIYENEIMNLCASLYGPRRIPTAFLVK
ncbi:MAG: hypothetical protein K0S55_1299 [Clostridia bacterium]|nr:hypothetical protein [Clostridia bacterium]